MLLTKTYSEVKTRLATAEAIGFMFVTHQYKLFGRIPVYYRDEILSLAP
jgi:hypothetical protein